MPTDYATDRTIPVEPAEPAVIAWPEPSPLDAWWTEVMDGVTPLREPRPQQSLPRLE
ncbi:hypothetical protein [Nocardia mangyaensis]|uniref:hypothetical protein n=1 Tax=Nocardia mangyaensis TaxID=2213200 RepID=UPI001431878B|nr:hypothetical protein [Nocardia mangyaensis]